MTQKQKMQPWVSYGLSAAQANEDSKWVALAIGRVILPITISKAEMIARMFSGNMMLYKYMMVFPQKVRCEDQEWHSKLLYAKAYTEFHEELEFQGWVNEIAKRMGPRPGERHRKLAAKLSKA